MTKPKPPGRPPVEVDVPRLIADYRRSKSLRAAAAAQDIGAMTARRRLLEARIELQRPGRPKKAEADMVTAVCLVCGRPIQRHDDNGSHKCKKCDERKT